MQINIVRRKSNKNLYQEFPKNTPAIIKKLLSSRSIDCASEIKLTIDKLLSNQLLQGIDNASSIIGNAIMEELPILIVGDYDADGATATALSYLALTEMGAFVEYYSTNRIDEGYGLSCGLVQKLHQNYDFFLLITVDLGISAVEGIALAKELGYQIVITDHHNPPEKLPNADAIVNPNLKTCGFPSKNLAGVGVAFYTIAGVRKYLEQANWFQIQNIAKPNLSNYLDLVALGTIADVMSLDFNNRILIAKGLEIIRQNRCRLGISTMLQQLKIKQSIVDCQDLSFQIIPRLNAAGRLSTMSIGVEWLIGENPKKASALSKQLSSLNAQRKQLETQSFKDAEKIIEENKEHENSNIIIFNEHWHIGLIGILAGKINQKYNKPVIVFCQDGDGLKGSGRSIKDVDLREVISQIDKNSDLVINFGGHKKAAGLTIKRKDFVNFKKMANRYFQKAIEALGRSYAIVETDGILNSEEFSLDTVKHLRQYPWGESFPIPQFDGEYEVLRFRKMGTHCQLTVKIDEQKRVDCMAFNQSPSEPLAIGSRIRLVYEMRENHYQGKSKLMLIVKHLLPV